MTIAKRLIILLVGPLAAFMAHDIFSWVQLATVEENSKFVSEQQIPSLAVLGNLSRNVEGLRVAARDHLLTTNQTKQGNVRSAFDAGEAEVNRLLGYYGDTLVTGDRDRRLFNDFREISRSYIAGGKQVMDLSAQGRREEALALLNGALAEIGGRLATTSSEWIKLNEDLATAAGKDAIDTIEAYRRNMVIAASAALVLSGWLGLLTFRRIVNPIRALETAVNAIAGGDYAKEVPFTKAADETGGLARSIDILKQGAAAMDEQRWVKSNASKLTADLQGASSFAEFGQRLVSGLVPLLGVVVAGVFLPEENPTRLRRIAAFGLANGAASDSFNLGEGLVGQCARERKPVSLANLPPSYLRIASGLGTAAPVQATALPLVSAKALLGVIEFASFRAFTSREQALLDELLPVVAMNLEILQRNLRTQELLEQVRNTEERTRLILESSAEGIFGTDTEGRITFVNSAACRMFGFTTKELMDAIQKLRGVAEKGGTSSPTTPLPAWVSTSRSVPTGWECGLASAH